MTKQQQSEDTSSIEATKFLVKLTPTDIARRIIEDSNDNDSTLLEAATSLALELEIDPDQMAAFITGSLKEMMQVECEDSGLIKRESVQQFEFE